MKFRISGDISNSFSHCSLYKVTPKAAHAIDGHILMPVATRYDKLAANYLAFIKLASIQLWIRAYEFTS